MEQLIFDGFFDFFSFFKSRDATSLVRPTQGEGACAVRDFQLKYHTLYNRVCIKNQIFSQCIGVDLEKKIEFRRKNG